MHRSRTPPSSSRSRSSRSTRSARGSTKSRRAGSRGGFADSLRRAAESGPTRKWVRVMRPPAPKIRFQVAKWIPINELTEEELLDYENEQAAIQDQKQNQQMELQEQPGDQHVQQKENKVKKETTTPEISINEAPFSAPGNVDSSATNPQLSQEQNSAEMLELPSASAEPADEPPTK